MPVCVDRVRALRRLPWAGRLGAGLLAASMLGCANPAPEATPSNGLSPGSRRNASTSPRTDCPPEMPDVATSAPAGNDGVRNQTHRLNPRSIVSLVYELSPLVRANREEMIAAQHGLEEFKSNLSRFEPFARVNGDTSRFPERRDAEAVTGEVVGGIENETYEGAILRLEGGASGSRVAYGTVGEDEASVDKGSGALVRARFEVPFVGSRKRQDRVISQAFQESNARKAELDYLSNFQSHVLNALYYYYQAVLHLDYQRAFELQLAELETLKKDPRVLPEDLPRLESTADSARLTRDQYIASYREYLVLLLSYMGVPPEQEVVLEESPFQPSVYVERSRTPEGRAAIVEEAYSSTPTFRVLNNAIKDAELQRSQSIVGKFDVTAFVEGTHFPFGAETYDDRVGGWQIGGGVTIRLNDQRVLSASRLKAEAQIRQFRAQIEAERLRIQRQVATETDRLRSYHDLRPQTAQLVEQKQAEYRIRVSQYLENNGAVTSIEAVLIPLSEWISAETRLAANTYYQGQAEAALMTSTGEVYRIAGMRINGETGESPAALGPAE